MSTFWWVVLITAIAGVCGTGVGGLLGAIMRRDSEKIVSLLLAFAGGVMLAVVCFDLLPEAFTPDGADSEMPLWLVVLGVAAGYGVVYLLNFIIDRYTNPEVEHIDNEHPKTADDLNELIHHDHFETHAKNAANNYELFIAGIVMACAIALHNVPEGMVIGASYASDAGAIVGGAGFILAIVICFHNIPEGMSISVPLIAGGMGKVKAVAITALSGLPTVIGAILGYFLGLLSPIWLTIALSFAGGAMIYVVLCELLPESFLMWKSKAPGAFALLGIMLGLVLVRA